MSTKITDDGRRIRQHSALNARDDMLYLAGAWPDLTTRLCREGSAHAEPVTGSRNPGLVINEFVSDTMSEVTKFTHQLADALIRTTDWLPATDETPYILADIARNRIGHFTANPDETIRAAFYNELDRLRRKVNQAAYPDGYRTLDTRLPCEYHDTTDMGERVPCAGTYTVRPTHDGHEPDLICSLDRTHRIPPAEWSRGRWRAVHEAGAYALLDAIAGRAG